MTNVPNELRYTKDHEWARIEGRRATIGITDHAQDQLTDVVYVELPATGKIVKAGDVLGTVESVKAVSEIFAPLSGRIVDANRTLEDSPEIINADPYGKGWMVVLELSNPPEGEALMDAAGYRQLIGEG